NKSSYKVAEVENRVKSITFHQGYSYEEFIEGIRPVLGENGTEKMAYKLENGIFKEHSINAEKELLKKEENAHYIDMINLGSSIWKVSLGRRDDTKTYNDCIESNDIAIDYQIEEDVSG